MKHAVDYFFTPSSPWTCLGHRRFMEIAERNDVAINVKPMDLSNKVFLFSGSSRRRQIDHTCQLRINQ